MGLPTPNEARAAGLTLTFAPIADTYVRSSSPTSTFGTKTSLRVRGGSTTITSYLKFTVTGLTGPVASAKLRLVVTNPSVNGGTVYPTNNVYAGGQTPWTETGLRWSNAPPASGAALSSKGAVATGEIVELDLGTAVTGNGTFSFMLTSPSSDYVDLSSKEGPNAPQLVVTQQAGVPTAPQNTSPPRTVGTPEDGQTLAADSGNWTGSPSPTFTYQWLRCDDDQLASCSTIGATTQSYMLVAADVGKRIRVEVTGTNSEGSDTATSDPTAPVTSPPPTTTFTPTDDAYVRSDNPTSNFGSSTSLRARGGSTTITSYLTFTVTGLSGPATAVLRLYVSDPSTGTMSAHTVADTAWSESTINWTGAPAIGSLLSSAGSPISGVWIPLDLGTIPGSGAYSFALTSSSSDAVWYASSESSNRPQLVVATSGDGPPVNTSPPMISGLARQGQTLSADVGAWTSSTPIAYGYQWQRCIGTGGSCSAIAGATGSTYVLAIGDVGSTIRVIVTATNAAGATAATSEQTAVVAPPAVVPTVETDPVPNAGDAADDPAIWIHPSDPALSTVIGTDKAGGIAVYDLAGRSIQYRPDGQMNNVDVRPGFALGGESVALVTAGNRSNDTIAIYRVDIPTRTLVDVAARTIQTGIVVYGSCMYHSPAIGKYYVVVTSQLGEVEQWELFDDGSSKVDATKVRSFTVGSQAEGCVADDELGHLYLGEERVGIWKYSAEPDAGTARTLVDSTGAGGHLVADVEGLTIAYGPSGTGYLIASSQGSSSFVVYRREAGNQYVKTFVIDAGSGIDAVSGTDGVDVTTASLGPSFPAGVFVAQDGSNDTGNQNFKLVPWESIVDGASAPIVARGGVLVGAVPAGGPPGALLPACTIPSPWPRSAPSAARAPRSGTTGATRWWRRSAASIRTSSASACS